ncbi:MAG: hypothetical protein RQ723_11135 [Desulfuromonadales bacterium]|nr:hypothetical protein [Desulfuromonadales bacterium]
MKTVRVMTYNIERAAHSGELLNPERILAVIEASLPDIVALQQVPAAGQADLLPFLVERLGMDRYGAVGGCAGVFLSWYPLKGVQATPLGDGGYCVRADLDLGGKRMHLINTRLDSSPGFRRRQIESLLGPDLLGNPSLVCPTLILGDFADYFWGSGNLELAASLRRAGRLWWPGTYPARLPLFGRDRAYVRGALRVVEAEINRSFLARKAARHLPLTLTVQIIDPRRNLRLTGLAGRRMEAAPG